MITVGESIVVIEGVCYTIESLAPFGTLGSAEIFQESVYSSCTQCQQFQEECPTPTPTQTSTITPTASITASATHTPTVTATITDTPNITPTQTSTPTITLSPTETWPYSTPPPTPPVTATQTNTPTNTITNTETPTQTPTNTITNTETPTNTPTNTISNTATITASVTETPTITPTNTVTASISATHTPTITPSNTVTLTITPTHTVTNTITNTGTPATTPSITPSNTVTNTITNTVTISETPEVTTTSTPTQGVTPTVTPSISASPTQTPTNTITITQTPSNTGTPTQTPTNTITNSQTVTPTNTVTQSETPTHTPTSTITSTPTITESPSQTPTNTVSQTQTQSNTPTHTVTQTNTITPTVTQTPTVTLSPSPSTSQTTTPTFTPTHTITPTNDLRTAVIFPCCSSLQATHLVNVPSTSTVGEVILYGDLCYYIESFVDQLGNHDLYTVSYTSCTECILDGNICITPTPTVTTTTSITPTPSITSSPTVTPTSSITASPTPTHTPTNSPTVSPTTTVTPTITQSLYSTPTVTASHTPSATVEICPDNLCVDFQVSSISGYNGTYINAGSYNDKDYYTGETGTGIIYYNGDRWCLSTELQGSCIFQSELTNAKCPSFPDSITNGECINLTQTPTVTSTSTQTPTVSVTITNTITNTPTNTLTLTQSSTNDPCLGFTAEISKFTPVTPTPTTPSETPIEPIGIEVDGSVLFQIFDNEFECGDIALLRDCESGAEFTVAKPILYLGEQVNVGKGLKVIFSDGILERCVEYVEDTDGSPTDVITLVLEVSDEPCVNCVSVNREIPNSPTPTTTITNTVTPSNENIVIKYGYERCDDGILVIQNVKVENIMLNQTFKSSGVCYTYKEVFIDTFYINNNTQYVEYNYNFVGSADQTFENCSDCSLVETKINYKEINTQWSFSSCYSNICDVNGATTTIYLENNSELDLDGQQVWSNDRLSLNYNPGRYVIIENDIYYIQMKNNKSYLQFYCKKGSPC